ncbi:MAG: hypothetical protein U1F43_04375 [Myxococcota bacterium]
MSLPSEVCAGQAFTLTEHSTDPDGRANVRWCSSTGATRSSVGIGNPSPTSPTSTYGHAYAQPGRYVVHMTVVDGDGGIDVAEAVVTVVDRGPHRRLPPGSAGARLWARW